MTSHTEIYLEDICDRSAFKNACYLGYISLMQDDNLKVAKYSVSATYDEHWTDEVRIARGLIFDHNERVLGRGFDKFFNHNQTQAPAIDDNTPVLVSNKFDGSLGIIFYDPYQTRVRVSTPGSLTSEQAIFATAYLHERYPDIDALTEQCKQGWCALVEIIYPQNRIVVNYQDKTHLELLGFRHLDGRFVDVTSLEANGLTWHLDFDMPYKTTYGQAKQDTLTSTKAADEFEGVVVFDGTHHIKIKTPAYLAAHKIIFGLDAVKIAKHLKDGTYEDLIAQIPDEFIGEIKQIAIYINKRVANYQEMISAMKAYLRSKAREDNTTDDIPTHDELTRKQLAIAIETYAEDRFKKVLFNEMCAGKDITKRKELIYQIIIDQLKQERG